MTSMTTKDTPMSAERDIVEQLRAERDALLQKPIDLAKLDSVDEDASGQMVAYYWWQQAQDARAEITRLRSHKEELIYLSDRLAESIETALGTPGGKSGGFPERITRLREALAQSPEDAEWLRELASALREVDQFHGHADRLEAIAIRLSGVRE